MIIVLFYESNKCCTKDGTHGSGFILTEVLSIDYNFKYFKIDAVMLSSCILHIFIEFMYAFRYIKQKFARSGLSVVNISNRKLDNSYYDRKN